MEWKITARRVRGVYYRVLIGAVGEQKEDGSPRPRCLYSSRRSEFISQR